MSTPKPILETARFYLRQITMDDCEELFRMESTPEVNRYTGESLATSLSELKEKIRRTSQSDYRVHGYGRWAVIGKETDAFLGWAGLKYLPEFEQVDLGYRFFPEYWGKGVGTETSISILKYGFENLGIERVIAVAHQENKASIRIMEKVGMKFDKLAPYEPGSEDVVWYSLDKKDWIARQK
ncbi:MAG: ribosomal-protein-alanine N-acetyltransferase [Crocinitomicaceae bacterium]|jgi:ribosomal-protein-alanine N-acetyltransferase